MAPAGLLLKLEGAIVSPAHTVKLLGRITVGNGLTVIVKLELGPTHPLRDGVTVITELIEAVVLFTGVKAGRLPVPLGASPMAVLELVQE